jgi:RND superfamily putative drug exporter
MTRQLGAAMPDAGHASPATEDRWHAWTRFVLRQRRWVALAWLVVTVIGLASSGTVYKAFSDQYSVPGRTGYETNQQITRLFGNGGNTAPLIPVVRLPDGVSADSPSVIAGLTQLAQRIERAVPGTRVASYATTHSRAFVSSDGRTTFLLAYAPPEAGSFGASPKAAHAAAAALRGMTVAGAPVQVTGLDALAASGDRHGGLGIMTEALIGGLGALLVLAFVFASLLALVPLLIAVVSIMTSFLLAWALTAVTDVSVMVAFLISLVGLGVAIDYSLLLITRWREERANGYPNEQAIARAMSTAGRAVVLSGTTVAIGLLALVVLPLPFLRSIGFGGLLIPLVSVAVTLSLLPIVLFTAGQRLEWPHRNRARRAPRAWFRWAEAVVARRGLAAAGGAALLVALTVAATTMHLGPAAGEPASISQHGAAAVALNTLQTSGIGTGVLTPIEVIAPASRATDVQAALQHVTGLQGALTPDGPGWRRGGTAVFDVLAHGDSPATVNRVSAALRNAVPQARVGGIVAQNNDFISATYDSFPVMIAVIAILTFLLLARALRSLVLPVKAVLANVLSIAAAWGVLTLVWQHGYGSNALYGLPASPTIPSWLPLIVFAFLFGLSMDYEVFILTRMREAYDATGSTQVAVTTGIGRTGRLVTSAALILFLGFVAMGTAPNTAMKMMATGLGAGILLDATIVRSLLVPAAVALLGRANWWLPTALARALRVHDAPAPAAAASGGTR